MTDKIVKKADKESLEYDEQMNVFDLDFCIKGKKAM